MHKTNLGISVGLMGALTCVIALLFGNSIWLLAIIAYILVKEENAWLKKFAVKVGVVVLAYAAVVILFNFVDYGFAIINNIFSGIDEDTSVLIEWPIKLDAIIISIAAFLKYGILILMGIKALSQGNIKLGFADKTVNKHF